jgi:fructose-1,6-bisphosphatase/inositol monophosphatase family enzyme
MIDNDDVRARLEPAEIERLHARALALADESRRLLRTALATGFQVLRKPDGSYVTSADFRCEERLRDLIAAEYPGHGVLGEEYAPRNPDAEYQWILDPVDGTEDFVHRVPTFGTILALHYRGRPLVGVLDHPALELRVSAAYGLGAWHDNTRLRLGALEPATIDGSERVVLAARANFTRYGDDGARFDAVTRAFPNHRIYRSCYGHALATLGAADAAVAFGERPWDLAASEILITEAGGRYQLLQDREVAQTGRVLSAVFGKPALVERLARVLGA